MVGRPVEAIIGKNERDLFPGELVAAWRAMVSSIDISSNLCAFELYPEVAIDVSACFDPDFALGNNLLDFLIQADISHAPADLREDILAALDSLSRVDGTGRFLSHPSGVFVIGGYDGFVFPLLHQRL